MSNSTSNLDLISASQAGKETTANSLFDASSAAMLFGRRASTTAALTWGYYGGNLSVAGVPAAIANGTVTLTASSTNYIEADASGVVSVNTAGFTGGRTQLYTVVTGASSVSSYTDRRLSGSSGPAGPAGAAGATGATGATGAAGAAGAGVAIGGTAGQVLTKIDATNYNTNWQTPAASTSPLTTKGDVYTFNTVNARLAVGTNGQVLTVDSAQATGLAWAAAGGLTNFTAAVNTAAPNATVPVVSLLATNAAINVDAVLQAKGTGSLAAQVADGATAGGNKRGSYAVDWQMIRSVAASIASGLYSVIAGGNNNKAASDYSTVGGGQSNNTNAQYATVFGGFNCTASGVAATAGGYSCTASGPTSFAHGESTTASASYAVGFGFNNTASGQHSLTVGNNNFANATYAQTFGQFASSRLIIGAHARSYQPFITTGDCQKISLVLSGQTTSATPKVLTVDQGAAGTTNQLTVQTNSSIAVTGLVVARSDTTGDTASWSFSASIKKGASTTAMVAACTPVSIAADVAASTWTLAVTADTTNNALAVTFTGVASKIIHVICSIQAVEVVRP